MVLIILFWAYLKTKLSRDSHRKKGNNANSIGTTVGSSDNCVAGFHAGRFLKGNRPKHRVLSTSLMEKKETLAMQHALNEDYRKERGPGSL